MFIAAPENSSSWMKTGTSSCHCKVWWPVVMQCLRLEEENEGEKMKMLIYIIFPCGTKTNHLIDIRMTAK